MAKNQDKLSLREVNDRDSPEIKEGKRESQGGDLDECWTTLKKLCATTRMLAAINPNGDFCISQADIAEVFGTLHVWSSEALREVEGYLELEEDDRLTV